MKYDSWPNLAAMFFEMAETRGDRPFVWSRQDGGFSPISWRQAAADVRALAAQLAARGIMPGDRVMLVAENRAEWPVADLAIMAAGAITVPTYVTNSIADHAHILADSGAKGAVVSTAGLAGKVGAALGDAPAAAFMITMEPPGTAPDGVALIPWRDAIRNLGQAADDTPPRWQALGRTDTACILYTSGTGGRPKGVALSHGAILSNCRGAFDMLQPLGLGQEVFLSFLPLSHAYEHTCAQFFPISIGAEIYHSSADQLIADMALARPTIMTAVPRLYETLHQRITRDVAKAGGVKAKLFGATVEAGRARYQGRRRGPKLLAYDAIGTLTVRRAIRKTFGGRLKALVSGGAPLNTDIGLFFTALGLRLLQGYGQTESAPVVSCNRPHDMRIETVGPPMTGVEVKIAEDGEILVRGELVMQGYWNNPEATAEAIRDGWLHTGDIGEIDPDGHIRITDRKKDIIVNSGGDNISPQRVEGMLALAPEIAQAMVYGDKRPHLVALIVPDQEAARIWAKDQGKPTDLASLIEDPDFTQWIGAAVDRVNRDLSVIEKVRRFALTAEPFTVENELMTPTLKIRRHAIRALHGDRLEALYGKRGGEMRRAGE